MKKEFTFKGKTYQIDPQFCDGVIINSTVEFHYDQFMYLIEIQDWETLNNRITNQLMWGGLIEIKN
jgi:hypothetical protein